MCYTSDENCAKGRGVMRVLLVGNTGYITERFMEEAFPECQVLILGDAQVRTNRKKGIVHRPFPEEEAELGDLFLTYEFEEVVYFSNYLTFHGSTEGEAEKLRRVLQYCKGDREVRILYLTGPESMYDTVTGKTLLVCEAEELCQKYAALHGISVTTVRLPYLYSGTCKEDYLFRLFEEMEEKGRIVFQESPEQGMFFLSLPDLSELLYKLTDDWENAETAWNIPDVFHLTFYDLEKELRKLNRSVQMEWRKEAVAEQVALDDKKVRYRYGWFPKISILEELPELYTQFLEKTKRQPGYAARLMQIAGRHKRLWQIAEFAAGSLFFEGLIRMTGNSARFRMIDLRLVCIVLFGSLYGINYGIAAAAVETFSLLAAYQEQGTGWQTLFYEPSNWLPFIFYFAVGSICGYVRMKNLENDAFIRSESRQMEEKFLFMRELYQDTLQDKRMYKKQILGSRDSFGKIFDITRKLDIVQPQELYIETLQVMEEVLENKSFAFYSVRKNNGFGRLEIASREMQGSFPNSIQITDFREAMETLEKGEVWANRSLLEGYPAYLAGIRRNGELVMLIFIQEADSGQMTLYYLNLFKILCGLVETALLRAMDYQDAIEYRQYLPDTHVLKTEFFVERLRLCHTMREKHLASYVLLALSHPGMSLPQADAKLQRLVRGNDVWGISEDRELYLILSQMDEASQPIVLERLTHAGFLCRVIDEQQQSGAVDQEKGREM